MKRYIYSLSLIFLFSCELVVDVDVPKEKRRLTVNAKFTKDSLWVADITLSNFILYEYFEPVTNAFVVIYQNGIAIDTLVNQKSQSSGGYQDETRYISDSGTPLNNEPYKIIVESPEHGIVSAESYVPNVGSIDDVEGTETDEGIEFKVKFKDEPDKKNFYKIEAWAERKFIQNGKPITSKFPINLEANDAVFVSEENSDRFDQSLLFDDKLFSGKEISLGVKCSCQLPSKVYFTLTTLSEDLYQYERTYNLQEATAGNPFATPVNVYNNIQEGYGIFGGYSEFTFAYEN